jgi:hypothetical protein
MRKVQYTTIEVSLGDFIRESLQPFVPFAIRNEPSEIEVCLEDCSYTSEWVAPGFVSVWWQNHRPWYAPWKKCVGFSLFLPPALAPGSGEYLVADCLSAIENTRPRPFGEFRDLLYRTCGDLKVKLS